MSKTNHTLDLYPIFQHLYLKDYWEHGQYPSRLPYSERVGRWNFRKRAKEFVVQGGMLYYKKKGDGSLRLAISSKEGKQCVFQVHFPCKCLGCFLSCTCTITILVQYFLVDRNVTQIQLVDISEEAKPYRRSPNDTIGLGST